MFRRRTPAPVAAAPSPTVAVTPSVDAATLAAQGWALPAGLAASAQARPPAWTLVGTIGSPTATPVDPAGLVVGEGWSLDWWVGGDDRWHIPSREAAVRQDLIDDAPLVETRVRIPGGDAVHRAFGIRSPRGTGDEWVIVEIENTTPVPLAAALVVRPVMADSLGAIGQITVEPVAGGSGPDQAHLVRVDGRPAVVLPRRPSLVQAGNRADGDALTAITANEAGADLVGASCPDGLATLALVFPVPHTAVLRVALPVGEVDDGEAVAYPQVVPDAPSVASGWDIHRRTPRFEIPERRLHVAVARARTHLLLAHDGEAVRRDGHHGADLEPGATEVVLRALDLVDRPTDVGMVVARWQERLADATPLQDAVALDAVSAHWLLHRDGALLEWMLPEVSAAVERLARADKRGALADAADRRRAAAALREAAQMLSLAGQDRAAPAVAALAERLEPPASEQPAASEADRLVAAAGLIAAGDPAGVEALGRSLDELSATGAWHGPGPGGRPLGHDLVASAALVVAARSLLVSDRVDGLALLPVFPEGWYGGGVEVHDAPTAFGRLSYAIRWHGTRPALLWDLEPHPGVGDVRITVPGLDPSWSTTEGRGDALLGEVTPPAGLDTITYVPDHPDIDPDMRRPGDEPEPPRGPLPESGTFS